MLLTPGFDNDHDHVQAINETFFEISPADVRQVNISTDFCKTKKELAELDIHRIYFPQRLMQIEYPDNPDYKGYEEPDDFLTLQMTILKSCRLVILIFPKNICSSSIILLGAAIHMEKAIFIFSGENVSLPRIISTGNGKNIKVFREPQVVKIPALLKSSKSPFLNREG